MDDWLADNLPPEDETPDILEPTDPQEGDGPVIVMLPSIGEYGEIVWEGRPS